MHSWTLVRQEIMSDTFIHDHKITLTNCHSPLTVEALDGKSIGGEKWRTSPQSSPFKWEPYITNRFTFTSSTHLTIQSSLACRGSEPTIFTSPRRRKEGQIIQWDFTCHHRCLRSVTPLPIQTIPDCNTEPDIESAIPAEYSDLAIAFSKDKFNRAASSSPQ